MDITTPCHGLPPQIDYAFEGRAYMQERVVDGFGCPAPGCYLSWDAQGKAQ